MLVGLIKWVNDEKKYGVIGTPDEKEYFFHKKSFLNWAGNVSQGQAIIFSKKDDSNRTDLVAENCRLVGKPEDWELIFSYLESPTQVNIDVQIRDRGYNGQPYYRTEIQSINLIVASVKTFCNGKSEAEIIKSALHYFDNELLATKFISYCEHIESSILSIFSEDASKRFLANVFAHFGENFNHEILFQVWKQKKFKYISYPMSSDEDDYEIPKSVLLSKISELKLPELIRIGNYSFGKDFLDYYIDGKFINVEQISSSELAELFLILEILGDNAESKKKLQLDVLYAEKVEIELTEQAEKLFPINNFVDYKPYEQIIQSIPIEINEEYKTRIISKISNIIASKCTEEFKPELWLKGYVERPSFDSIQKYFINPRTETIMKISVLSKIQLAHQFTLLKKHSTEYGFDKTLHLINSFLKTENPDLDSICMADVMFDIAYWMDKKGGALIELYAKYLQKETTENQKFDLFIQGYINDISENLIYDNISNLNKDILLRIFNRNKHNRSFIETILKSKILTERHSNIEWLYDLAMDFLDSESFISFDKKVSDSIKPSDYFLLWKKSKARLFPNSYIRDILDDNYENYNQIKEWINNKATTSEEICDFLLSYLSKNEAVTNRKIFKKQFNHIKYLVFFNELFQDRIMLFQNDFYSVILWHLGKTPVFDFDLLKSKFIYFAPEEQTRIIKRLFLLKAKGEFDLTIKKLNELTRFDIDLYKTNLEFNPDIPIDITTDVIIQALSTFREKGRFMIENELFNVVLEDIRNNETRRFKLSNFFEECQGRCEDIYNWNTNGNIKKSLTTDFQGNEIQFFSISFSWDNLGWDTFEEIKEEVKKLPGRRWIAEENYWSIPLKYEKEVLAFARKHEFFLDFEGNNYQNNTHLVEFKRKKIPNGITFCEGRLANKPDMRFSKEYWWCAGQKCFNKCETIHSIQDWEKYTLLDFCEILGFNTDETNKMGDYIPKGHYYQFVALINRFNRLLDKLYCTDCNHILYPSDFGTSNFAAHTIVRFQCRNKNCNNNDEIYLTHCLNGQCKSIIDSRVSNKCDNNWVICENCGSCCSHKVFKRKLSDLEQNRGIVPPNLIECVDKKLGHLERAIYFCYKCSSEMTEVSNEVFQCITCKVKYNTAVYNFQRPHRRINQERNENNRQD